MPAAHVGEGAALLAAVVEQGMEGVVGKRLGSTYRENARGGDWIKVKQQQRQEFVVVGWTEGAGRRAGSLGALLLGYHDARPAAATRTKEPQRLVYAGSVGTGFSDRALEELQAMLEPLAIDHSPIDVNGPGSTKPVGKWQAMRARDRERAAEATGAAARAGGTPVPAHIHYVEPKLVCEVEYTEFTRDGTLRHPSFKGLRDDKSPQDVVREDREAT